VTASGLGTLSYQWQHKGIVLSDGGRISGSHTANLSLTAVVPADTGTYQVLISGPCSTTLSRLAVLFYPGDDQFTSFPKPQIAAPGFPAGFTVATTNLSPFSIQWRRNGQALVDDGRVTGSQTAALHISPVIAADSGAYDAQISNACESIVSSTAALDVEPSQPAFERTWGSRGAGPAQFGELYGLSSDSSGLLYVADRTNNRIDLYSRIGTPVGTWGQYGTGPGEFNYPWGVAADPRHHRVLVADTDNHRIQQFAPDGTFQGTFGSQGSGPGQFYLPGGVTVDSSGNIYVTDSGNNRIQKFDSTGTYLTSWGSEGSGQGQFEEPRNTAISPSGKLYVSDTYNHRIQVFSASGAFLFGWGSFGTGRGKFQHPGIVSLDDSGNVYVADTDNNRIQEFTPNGAFLTMWGNPGTLPGQFKSPVGIVVNGGGDIFVLDAGNYRLQEFSLCGSEPSVNLSPTSQLVVAGSPVEFDGGATGTGSLSYAWQKGSTLLSDDAGISGSNSSILTIASAQAADAGFYSLRVSNACGTSISPAAQLTIQCSSPILISQQPASQTVPLGQPASFQVTATGCSPLSYQWRHRAVPIPGATTCTYNIASVAAADAGPYTVLISGGGRVRVSSPASLNIPPGPVFTRFALSTPSAVTVNVDWATLAPAQVQALYGQDTTLGAATVLSALATSGTFAVPRGTLSRFFCRLSATDAASLNATTPIQEVVLPPGAPALSAALSAAPYSIAISTGPAASVNIRASDTGTGPILGPISVTSARLGNASPVLANGSPALPAIVTLSLAAGASAGMPGSLFFPANQIGVPSGRTTTLRVTLSWSSTPGAPPSLFRTTARVRVP
jgi:hypothetical protein